LGGKKTFVPGKAPEKNKKKLATFSSVGALGKN